MAPAEIRAPAAADIPALERFLSQADAHTRAALLAHRAHPRTRPSYLQAIFQGDHVVGCGFVTHRRLRHGAALLDIADLTLAAPGAPDEQLASLIGACLAPLPDAEIGWARLRAAPARYAPLGLAPARLHTLLTPPKTSAPARPSLRPATPADREDLAALYAFTYRRVPLSEERLRVDWDALIAAPLLLLDDQRGRCVAYAHRSGGMVTEAAAADAGAARDLLRALAPTPLTLPLAHPVAQAALHAGWRASTEAPPETEDADLLGIVDLPLAVAQIGPQLALNLAGSLYAGWEGGIRIELPAGAATLRVGGHIPRIDPGDRPHALRLRAVQLAGLAQLLLGFRPAADLRATGELQCDDSALGLLDALFQAPSFG